MRAYLKRVVFSATAFFLLMALIAPAISGTSSSFLSYSSNKTQPVSDPPESNEPASEPETPPSEPEAPIEEPSATTAEPEIPQGDGDPAAPDDPCPEIQNDKGKKLAKGQGYLKNLFKKN